MPMPTAAIQNPIAPTIACPNGLAKSQAVQSWAARSAASSATLAQQRTQHHSGKAEIECRLSSHTTNAMDEGLCLVSAFIGIKQSLHEPPARKSTRARRTRAASIKMTDRVASEEPATHPRVPAARRRAPTAAKRGKGPDNQEHDPARRVADPAIPIQIWAAAWSCRCRSHRSETQSDRHGARSGCGFTATRSPGWTFGLLHRFCSAPDADDGRASARAAEPIG